MRREPLPTDWIQARILAPGALAGLDGQSRGITLALVETGCRPSELCSIAPESIFLDEEVPYLRIIEAKTATGDAAARKTRLSHRRIPLVGVAAEVFRRHPDGFPRYRDRAKSYAAAADRYLRRHGLLPSPGYSLYSFRRAFECRMMEHGVDLEVRQCLMGGGLDPRPPMFGETVPLQLCQKVLNGMAFDFDPAIV
jgi:integrase